MKDVMICIAFAVGGLVGQFMLGAVPSILLTV